MAGERAAAQPRSIRLTAAPEPSLVGTIRLVVAAVARRAGLDDEQVEDLKVAVSELCSASVTDRLGPVQVRLAELGDRLLVEVVDAAPTVVAPTGFAGGPAGSDDRAFGLALVGSLVNGLESRADPDGGRVTRFWLPVGGRPSLRPV
jgi:anti-sigma regulatory factor (Ser/Thr protein kinase)